MLSYFYKNKNLIKLSVPLLDSNQSNYIMLTHRSTLVSVSHGLKGSSLDLLMCFLVWRGLMCIHVASELASQRMDGDQLSRSVEAQS